MTRSTLPAGRSSKRIRETSTHQATGSSADSEPNCKRYRDSAEARGRPLKFCSQGIAILWIVRVTPQMQMAPMKVVMGSAAHHAAIPALTACNTPDAEGEGAMGQVTLRSSVSVISFSSSLDRRLGGHAHPPIRSQSRTQQSLRLRCATIFKEPIAPKLQPARRESRAATQAP